MYRFQFEDDEAEKLQEVQPEEDLISGEGALSSDIYTVSQLNREARELLESTFPFIWVEGEISNFTHHRSGHMYFTLKDEAAEIDAVMFDEVNRLLRFQPEDGLKVLAFAKVTLYERRGRYQLSIKEMRPAGIGRLQLEFERLKEKLRAEGLFDERYKKEIPAFPERVGVITSTEGAAIRDICSVVSRRYPPLELCLFPAKVQGKGAAEEIADAVRAANRYSEKEEKIDTLIVGRGGGSLEDLWAFNEEIVARAIFSSKIPVISAVGHEVDFTIADFVADLRAPTPSVAAERAVPDGWRLSERIDELLGKMARYQGALIKDYDSRLSALMQSYAFRLPLKNIEEGQQTLDILSERLTRSIKLRLKGSLEEFQGLTQRLEAANPLAILRRGYSIAESEETGEVLKSAEQVEERDRVKVRLYQGELICRVEEKK